MTVTAPRTERVFSKDPEILREDLLAGLTIALGDDLPSHITEVDSIVADLASFDDSQEALRAVLRTFGPVVFGAVVLHQIDEKTSLMGQSETLTRRESLAAAATVSGTSVGRRTSSTRTTGRTRTGRCSTRTVSTSSSHRDAMSFHIALTGHRPHLLGGYDLSSPFYQRLQSTLELAIIGALDAHDHVTLHSGLALGADTVWSHAILAQKVAHPDRVSFVCEVPFPGQADRWPAAAQEDWKQQMYGADVVNMYAESYSPQAMRDRNEGMVRTANLLLAVWNGTPSGTGHAVAFAHRIGVPVHRWHPDEFRDSPQATG